MHEGKYTLELFAKEQGIKKQTALNTLCTLKKKGLVSTTGGGPQKRIYTIRKFPKKETNGFYTLVNRYNKDKLTPQFSHHTIGNYTIEHAIIDGIKIGDARTLRATQELFRHVTNWKRLFQLAKKQELTKQVHKLYQEARKNTKTKRMPKTYLK